MRETPKDKDQAGENNPAQKRKSSVAGTEARQQDTKYSQVQSLAHLKRTGILNTLSPQEAYLWSRLEHQQTLTTLVSTTPFDAHELETMLERLLRLNVVQDNRADLGGPQHEEGIVDEVPWRNLSPGERIRRARSADAKALLMMCRDQNREVVNAILNNECFGLNHARTLARHHKGVAGLQALLNKAGVARNTSVRHNLLLNSGADERIYDQLAKTLSLKDLYLLTTNRSYPGKTRVWATKAFNQAFKVSPAAQQAKFILRNDGRCFSQMKGLRATPQLVSAIAKHKPFSKTLRANLRRWSGISSAAKDRLLG